MNRTKHILFTLVLVLLVFSVLVSGQTVAEKFTIGAFVSGNHRTDPLLYSTFKNSGLNTIVQYADETTNSFLSGLNVIANNADGPLEGDWIQHYATGYYSKWESEQNQTDPNRVGVKHKYGDTATWKGKQCWSTNGLSFPADSLVYGPHYRQEKRYKRWLYGGSRFDVKYTARYRMALDYNPSLVNPNENVCVIKVVHRYALITSDTTWTLNDAIYRKDTLKVGDFDVNGILNDYKFEELGYDYYEYPSEFIPKVNESKSIDGSSQSDYPLYTDSEGDNGIQFCVEWLRNDNLCTLYIDYAEVYDNDGWNDFVEDSSDVKQKLVDCVQNYSGWTNINYWYGQDEPYTIDAFTPMHIVDSLVQKAGGAPLITEFYPYWTSTNTINGDTLVRQFYNIAKPEKLMIDIYPFGPDLSLIPLGLDALHKKFQEVHSIQPGFYYVGQSFGFRKPDDSWCVWKKPESNVLKASVMLALAHGSKGIMFWNYDSYASSSDD